MEYSHGTKDTFPQFDPKLITIQNYNGKLSNSVSKQSIIKKEQEKKFVNFPSKH